jgi:hypothetical protein
LAQASPPRSRPADVDVPTARMRPTRQPRGCRASSAAADGLSDGLLGVLRFGPFSEREHTARVPSCDRSRPVMETLGAGWRFSSRSGCRRRLTWKTVTLKDEERDGYPSMAQLTRFCLVIRLTNFNREFQRLPCFSSAPRSPSLPPRNRVQRRVRGKSISRSRNRVRPWNGNLVLAGKCKFQQVFTTTGTRSYEDEKHADVWFASLTT